MKEWAASKVCDLAVGSNANCIEVASCGGIGPLVALVRDGNDEQKEDAAGALWNLAVNNENRVKIALCGGISPLMELVRNGNDIQKEKAAAALWNIAYKNPDVAVAIRPFGAVEPLLRLVRHGAESPKLQASGTLAFLNPDPATTPTIAMHGGIEALIRFVQDASNDGDREEGLIALRNLCCIRDKVDLRAKIIFNCWEEAQGRQMLSQLVESGSEQTCLLVSEILSMRWILPLDAVVVNDW